LPWSFSLGLLISGRTPCFIYIFFVYPYLLGRLPCSDFLVLYSGLLGFLTLSIVGYSKEHSSLEMMCSLEYQTINKVKETQ
jgi:hypothetical protein